MFDELIPLCIARDDRFHLGVAYANRSWLWSARGEVDHTVEDLRIVIQLARESGQVDVERDRDLQPRRGAAVARGSLDEALRLARRSATLQGMHGEASARLDRLLLARIARRAW